MFRKALVGLVVTGAVSAAAFAAAPAKQPTWHAVDNPKGEVVIFGDVARNGFYSLRADGLSLRQLVVTAGLSANPDGTAQLRRVDPKGQVQFVEVGLKSLDQDGNIALQANDVVQVSAAHRAG